VGDPGAAREQLHSLPHSIFQAARACRTRRTGVCEACARSWGFRVHREVQAVEAQIVGPGREGRWRYCCVGGSVRESRMYRIE
jgi:hypothetical protein